MENKDLRKEIESLIQEVEKTHRYSMSRIYGAYNEAFHKNEQPQACASCLIRKVKELRQWLDQAIDSEQSAVISKQPVSPKGRSSVPKKAKSKK